MNKQTYELPMGSEALHLEFNDLALYANGSVTAHMGNTVVMAVVTMGGPSRYDDGGFPLRVDYQERNYARGAILGSKFNKREGKPTDEAVLTGRVIDRTIRPFFPDGFSYEVQVVVTVLSIGDYDPDVVAINAVCVALECSDIPWNGPVACVRVSADYDQQTVMSPTFAQMRSTENYHNTIVAGTRDRIVMIETEGSEVTNAHMIETCQVAQEHIKNLCGVYEQIKHKQGNEKQITETAGFSDTLETVFKDSYEHIVTASLDKVTDKEVVNYWKHDFARQVQVVDAENREKTGLYFEQQIRRIVRAAVTEHGDRIDGRSVDEVRPLYAQAGGVAGRQHGTGIFYRGETRVLSVATLGSLEDDALLHHEMEVDTPQRWMHHYNFPPYSVGETGRVGSPKRREIGHGTLAQKALERVLPNEGEFPYAMRVVTEVMSSNGSTSMAATCGATLALMDAGVPIAKPVGGIAMGAVISNDSYVLLTDIIGKEDYYGDMDFKITGTRDGITAIQLDCKNHGLSIDLIQETLTRSLGARAIVIDAIEGEIKSPRELTPYVERITTYQIPDGKVGLVIGTGGVTIKRITKESGAKIDIKRDGTAYITGNDGAPQKAVGMIQSILGV